MKIAIGADHAGFSLKETLRRKLADEGYEVVDFGTGSAESCDYPDFAQSVAAMWRRGAATAAYWSAPRESAWPWPPTKWMACAPLPRRTTTK